MGWIIAGLAIGLAVAAAVMAGKTEKVRDQIAKEGREHGYEYQSTGGV